MPWLLLVAMVVAMSPCVAWAADKPQDVPVASLGEKFRLIGKLGEPLGDVVTVQGFVVDGPSKGYEGGPNLRVQRINGRSTQQEIQIHLSPYLSSKFGDPRRQGIELPKLEDGKTYEFEGYETGQFVGVPWEAYKRADMNSQTSGFHFRHDLVVYKGKKIEPIVWSPADFVDREALLEGKAVNRDNQAYIEGHGWKLLTDHSAGWPKDFEGKTVEAFGTIKKTHAGEYQLEKGATRLVSLEDQRGRLVELRGTALSRNGDWWFMYRGTDLYVEDLENLPGWKENWPVGAPVLITGRLEEVELPDLGQIGLKGNPDKKKQFIVRKAAWKRLDKLLSPERVSR